MKRPKPTTAFWPGHGFFSRLGPKMEDWEEVPFPEEEGGLSEYEISLACQRHRRRTS